jgi:hypothetical protein
MLLTEGLCLHMPLTAWHLTTLICLPLAPAAGPSNLTTGLPSGFSFHLRGLRLPQSLSILLLLLLLLLLLPPLLLPPLLLLLPLI